MFLQVVACSFVYAGGTKLKSKAELESEDEKLSAYKNSQTYIDLMHGWLKKTAYGNFCIYMMFLMKHWTRDWSKDYELNVRWLVDGVFFFLQTSCNEISISPGCWEIAKMVEKIYDCHEVDGDNDICYKLCCLQKKLMSFLS